MGIKKESIPHLFDVFQRVDEEKNRYIEGTGLGLSIVKQLVDLMGGEIAVNSVYGKGSTFLITLPQQVVAEKPLGELDLEKKHALGAREHYRALFEAPKSHVLIVDDNSTNLLVAEKLLQDTKVNVQTASSGAECLKLTLQKRYDVILMDHLMPVMDGIQCLHKIRTQTGGLNLETPIVALTANAGGENQALYAREGFDGYLLKPVTGIQLETELLRLLPREQVQVNSASDVNDLVVGPVLGHNKKQTVLVTTDSVSDIPRWLADKYQIAVMPYRVLTEGGEFKDGEEVESEGILSYILRKEKRVRTDAPLVEEYEAFFAEQLTRAQQIIHIAMAKNVSGGYASSQKASRTFDNVTVVDCGHLSSGMGLIVLFAAAWAADGMPVDQILREIERLKKRTRTSFVAGTTEYLARSGRISPKISAICEACMLHPVLVLRNSSMKVGSIRMGTRDVVWRKYINATLRSPDRIDTRLLFITYVGLTRKELEEIEAKVKQKVPFEKVIYQKASPAISINSGPETFGLLFAMKE